jgi:hypothetical protein
VTRSSLMRGGKQRRYGMLRPLGKLHFAVPTGPQRSQFDADRVFSVPDLRDMSGPWYRIDSVAYVDKSQDLSIGVAPTGHEVVGALPQRVEHGVRTARQQPRWENA